MSPLISVIIPVNNRLTYIQAAIESVIAQTYHQCEILVVDDGSVVDVAGALRQLPVEVIFLRQDHRGVAAARNLGVRSSRGEYVAFLDSDDLFMPEKLERQLAVFRSNPGAAMVYSDEYLLDEDGNISTSPLREGRVPPLPSGWIAKDFFADSFIAMMTVLVRRTVFDEVGGFDECLLYNEDDDLWFRIMQKYPVICSDYISGARRLHDSNMSRDRNRMVYYQLKCIEKYFEDYPAFCIDNSVVVLKRIRSLFAGYLRWSLSGFHLPSYRVVTEYGRLERQFKRMLSSELMLLQ